MSDLMITGVRVHPGDSAFLVDDGKTSIMYDSGFAFTGYRVADKIKEILGERKLDYIFLTHSHYDHALGSAYALRYWNAAKVVAGEYAAKIFTKPSAKAVMRELDRKLAVKCGISEYEFLADELRVDIPVRDGDKIEAGNMTFIALELPGHTKCSVGYYCAERKLLLGTETLGVYNGIDDVVPSYLVGYATAMASIERVCSLDIENLLVPHYGVLGREETRFYLEKSKESASSTAERIVEMLKSGCSEREIVDDFKKKFYHGYIKEIYPTDAMELNTGITVNLIKKEFDL